MNAHQQKEENIRKYKELYDLSVRLFDEEQARFFRMDEKASRYLSAITVLLGAYMFFAKWMVYDEQIVPPRGVLEWAIILTYLSSFGALAASWLVAFSVLRVRQTALEKMALTDETIRYFDTHTLINTYYGATKTLKGLLTRNIRTTDSKSRRLSWAHRWMEIAILVLILFSVMYIAYNWVKVPSA